MGSVDWADTNVVRFSNSVFFGQALQQVLDKMVRKSYDRRFYEEHDDNILASARVVVPLMLDLAPVKSVCDVGCGVASWLSVFRECGVHDILGMDGDYVDRKLLYIPADRFIPLDLTKPVALDRRYDLAVSLEVAEHLPDSRGVSFVHDLTALASVVMFSAAVPGQGGTHHINEQWQSYWARLFAAEGYVPVDIIRSMIWDNPAVEWWYRQNIIIYCEEKALAAYPKLASVASPKGFVRSDVHPHLYQQHYQPRLLWLVQKVPSAVRRAVQKRTGLE